MTSYPASEARTIREHLEAEDIDPQAALGLLPSNTLNRLTIRFPTTNHYYGGPTVAGFTEVEPSNAFPDRVFTTRLRGNVYLGTDGKLVQSA